MSQNPPIRESRVVLPTTLFRGAQQLRIALVGMPTGGKTTLFQAVSSTAINQGELAGTQRAYRECRVQIGFDEANLVDLPSISSLHRLPRDDLVTLKYLL